MSQASIVADKKVLPGLEEQLQAAEELRRVGTERQVPKEESSTKKMMSTALTVGLAVAAPELVGAKALSSPGAISGLLREGKMAGQTVSRGAGSKAVSGARTSSSVADIGSAYREQIKQARSTKGMGEQAVNAVASMVSRGTSEALKESWMNLIDSFGLTLIYINLHVFCRFVLGEKFFCKLGQEWMSLPGGGSADVLKTPGASLDMPLPKSGGGGLFGLGLTGIGILEAALLAFIDIALIILIAVSLTPIMIMVNVLANPGDAAWSALTSFFGL